MIRIELIFQHKSGICDDGFASLRDVLRFREDKSISIL